MRRLIVSVSIIIMLFAACNLEQYPDITYEREVLMDEKITVDSSGYIEIKLAGFKVISPTDPQLANEINRNVSLFLNSEIYEDGQYESPQQLKESIVEDYKSIKNENPEFAMNYLLERVAEVKTDTLGIFSFAKNEITFFGGAHPNSTTIFANYDVEKLSKIKLEDLFQSSAIPELNKIGEDIFRTENKIKPDANLEEAGFWFENGKFSLNDNFLITTEGIVFYYNPYEIAPYAVGSIEIMIPFSKVDHLIADNSVLTRFIEN